MVVFASGADAADIGLKVIGGKLGFVMPEDPVESTFGLGVVAKLGSFSPTIAFDGFVEFWSKSYDAPYLYGNAEWTFTEIAIGAMAKYLISTSGDMQPYVGGGLAFNIGKSSWKAEGVGDDSSSNTDLGIHPRLAGARGWR